LLSGHSTPKDRSPIKSSLETVFVDNQERLNACVQSIAQATVLGFDTEFVGDATYEPLLCLLQVSTEEAIYLIDPLARIDLRELWLALTAPGRELVAFAALHELQFCRSFAGRLPETLFDPQLAAGLTGFGYPISHSNMVRGLFGIQLSGSEAYTDWRRRPFTRQQLAYAADDVRYLLASRRVLADRARSMDRMDWLRSEFIALVERVGETDREDSWRRVAGASRLDRRTLAVVRELWRWRDGQARAANVPPRRVLRDDLLVEIAKRRPKSVPDLFALRGMDRAGLRKAGANIVAAVQAGLSAPQEELRPPGDLAARDDPPQVAILGQLLSVLTNSLAAELQVATPLLATTADLQAFVRWHLGLVEDQPAVLQSWRGEVLGQALVELMEGRRFVRVGDVTAANPLTIERFDTD
jgi:ribonuclease D